MTRVVHFEIAARNPEQMSQFYAEVFGWTISKGDGPQEYWQIKTGNPDRPGIDGGILAPQGLFTGFVNTIQVPAIDDYMALITKSGGKVVTDKMTVPGVGFLAYCRDPEGNLFGIMQPCEQKAPSSE